MITAFVRTVILYLLIIAGLRLMGKRQIGELEPGDLVLTLIISDLASVPMQDFGIPLVNGAFPIVVLLSLSMLVSYFSLKSIRFRALVCGRPTLIIREGKITHWGISEANEDYLRRANAVCPVTAVENRYSMMARQYENLFPVLEELGVGLVAFSPMANGFLTGRYGKGQHFDPKTDYRAAMPQFTDAAVEQNAPLLELLHRMAEEKDATPAQISLAWMLCKKPWIVPIPGSRKPERMAENAGAASVALTAAEVQALDGALDKMEMSAVFGGTKCPRS